MTQNASKEIVSEIRRFQKIVIIDGSRFNIEASKALCKEAI